MDIFSSMDLTKNRSLVLKLLQEQPDLRSNDRKLMAEIWRLQLKNKGYKLRLLSTAKFLELLRDDELANFTSITRIRRIIQKDHPELDPKYDKQDASDQVKDHIKTTPELYKGGTP